MGLTRLVRRLALALVLATAGSTVAPGPVAHATTLAPLSHAQLTDASTYVVRGVVREVWPEFDEGDVLWTRARVEIEHTYKGPDRPTELVVDTLGGRIDDRTLNVSGAARFSEGETVVLFLSPIAQGTRLTPVGMYLGKYTVRRAPGEERHYALRWQARRESHYDHRFLPHPTPAERLYLDDLVQQIERRLDTGWDGQPIPGISRQDLEKINTPERRFRR